MVEIKNIWVDILDSAGTRLGSGPLRAANWTHTSKLDVCGEFAFSVDGSDPNIGALGEKRTAVCWFKDKFHAVGIFGAGIIDKIELSIDSDGIKYNVSGLDLAKELSYHPVGNISFKGLNGEGQNNIPEILINSYLQTFGWLITNGSTQDNLYTGFDGESVLNALTRVVERSGEHWRLGDVRRVEWLGKAANFQASGLYAVQHIDNPVGFEAVTNLCIISALDEESDTSDLVTAVIPRGSGNGAAILTLKNAASVDPVSGYAIAPETGMVTDAAANATYGYIAKTIDFKDIGPLSNTTLDIQSAQQMLYNATVEYLQRHSAPQKFYRLKLAGVGNLLRPGTTLRVRYKKVQDGILLYNLENTFNILEVRHQIDKTASYSCEILISLIDRQPQSDENFLASQIQEARVISAHQQLGPSSDTLTWRDEMDNEHGAGFRFWTGDEYTSIQRAVFRFRVQSLRSTVKSVGGSSTTSGSGGGGTSTSASGGGQTADGGAHSHWTTPVGGESPDPDYGFSASGNLLGLVSANGGAQPAFQVGVTENHEHTIAAHTHAITIPAHTHSLTANVSMQYGIFEESGANTLALTDLVIKLNGGADLRANVENIGNGWYALELTEHGLCDAVFRPAQGNNELSITTSVDKTARIEAQLTIRGVVQAVAYTG
jgi:hypothetical protein